MPSGCDIVVYQEYLEEFKREMKEKYGHWMNWPEYCISVGGLRSENRRATKVKNNNRTKKQKSKNNNQNNNNRRAGLSIAERFERMQERKAKE